MAIILQNSTVFQQNSGTTALFNHINNSATNTVVLIQTGRTGNTLLTSVKYGGIPLTFANRVTDASTMAAEIWYLVNAPTGNNLFEIALNGKFKPTLK